MQPIKNVMKLRVLLFATAPFGLCDAGAAGEGLSLTQMELADARGARHCHNTRRRVYCHNREILPLTVPPGATVKT